MTSRLPIVAPLERALFLRSLDLLSHVRAHELALLAQLLREEWIPRGTTLHEAGTRVEVVHLLVEGEVRADSPTLSSDRPMPAPGYRTPSPGFRGRDREGAHQGDARIVSAPAAFGLVEALAQAETRERAVAATNALALVLDVETLFDVLEDQFALVLALREALAREASAASRPLPFPPPETGGGRSAGDTEADLARDLIQLRRAPELRAFGVGVLAALLRAGHEVHVAAGEALWQAGEEARFFALVRDGRVHDGEHSAGRGDILGLAETLCPVAHGAAAIAETEVDALRIDTAALVDLAEDHFHIASAMLAFSARQVLRAQVS